MFWDVFNDLCEKNNVKPNTVTKSVGLSSATATNWKLSGRTPNGDALIKIADYFDVSVDYLLGMEQKTPPQNGGEEVDNITADEQEELELFRQLSPDAQAKVMSCLAFLVSERE